MHPETMHGVDLSVFLSILNDTFYTFFSTCINAHLLVHLSCYMVFHSIKRPQFGHSLADGSLKCYHYFSLANNAGINVLVHVSL